jgi:hypothetical protein
MSFSGNRTHDQTTTVYGLNHSTVRVNFGGWMIFTGRSMNVFYRTVQTRRMAGMLTGGPGRRDSAQTRRMAGMLTGRPGRRDSAQTRRMAGMLTGGPGPQTRRMAGILTGGPGRRADSAQTRRMAGILTGGPADKEDGRQLDWWERSAGQRRQGGWQAY